MRIMTYGGYLYTDKFFLRATQNRRLHHRREVFAALVQTDGELIELNRICVIIDPNHQADRYVGFLPVIDPVPETLQQLDTTDLIIVDYEYFKLILNEFSDDERTFCYYLNLANSCILIKRNDTVIAGIMPIESVRLDKLLHEK